MVVRDLSRNSINHSVIQSPEEVNAEANQEDSTAESENVAELDAQTKDSPVPSPERRHSVSSEELEATGGDEDVAGEQSQYADGDEQQSTLDETDPVVIDSVVDTSEGQGQDLIAENVSDDMAMEEEVC